MSGSNDRVAGELLAQIRRTSGMTQAELARRSGLQSSVLSAYEHARRQPSVSALARIARAAGLGLEISPLANADALKRSSEVLVQVLEVAERDGQVRLLWDATPIDVFFSVLPFHDEVERNIRHVSFGDRTIPVLDCTGIAVFKAMFARPRDWVDIEAMVEARSLDVDEATRWGREMVGHDPRVERLADLRALRRPQGAPPPRRPHAQDAAAPAL